VSAEGAARRKSVGAIARTATQGLAFYAGVSFVGAYFAQNATAAAVLQAVLAEWGAGRLGITWSDPLAKAPTVRAIVRRALRGASIALTGAVALLGFALVTKAARLEPNAPSLVPILVGLVVPAFVAMRDELLLRGLVLRVLPAETPRALSLLACGLSQVAATIGADDASRGAATLVTAGLGGVVLGALWRRDRGAWMAWGAHTAWSWASGPLAHGGLVDVRASLTPWGGGDQGLGAGWAAVTALVPMTALLVLLESRYEAKEASRANGEKKPQIAE
jgi:hypothetical protein